MPKLKFGDVTWLPFRSLSGGCGCLGKRCPAKDSKYLVACPKSEIGLALKLLGCGAKKAGLHEFGVTKDGQVMGARRLSDAPPYSEEEDE